MTPERLAAILQAYGANPDRWPDAERMAALALMNSNAVGHLMREEHELDALLGTYEVPAPGPATKGRVLAKVLAHVDLAILRRWWVGFVVTGAGLAGVAAGVLTLMVTTHGIEDRQSMDILDEQVTIFTPFDIEEDPL